MKTQGAFDISIWWVASLVATAAVVLLTVSPVVLGPVAAIPAYALFSSVCHQIVGRSFEVGGITFAVCQRCFGLYTGFLAGLVLSYPMRSKSERILSKTAWLVAVPVLAAGIEWSGDVMRIWSASAWSRFATGAMIGISVGIAIGLILITTNKDHLRSRKERLIQTTRVYP